MNGILPPVLPAEPVPAPFAGHDQRPLTTLYTPPSPHRPRWSCAVRRVDDRGRVIDTTALPALGWPPGIELGWRRHGEAVAVGRFGPPELWITATGNLRLPARFRRMVGIRPADRILLAANPAEGILLIFPPAALDSMIIRQYGAVTGEEAQR
ncbi:hypothetical protein [Nocardia abscessus]|uniref:hypothetical protein n=1 Tax=Nocardia abscessus TaxID=120957 RepID=UPI0002D85029|nr:hypothetical protein [Nocardia abscessus]MCC3332021.1 hypothetical protein [Nocardia abscessus]